MRPTASLGGRRRKNGDRFRSWRCGRTAAAPGAPTTPRPRLATSRPTSRLGALLTATALVLPLAMPGLARSAQAAAPASALDLAEPIAQYKIYVLGEVRQLAAEGGDRQARYALAR